MTEPQQPPEEQPPEDAGSLVPILTALIAAYLTYQAGQGAVKGSWRTAAATLGLTELAGEALLTVAQRALNRQRQGKGLTKKQQDEMWMHVDAAAKAGADAGLQRLVTILRDVGESTAAKAAAPTPPKEGDGKKGGSLAQTLADTGGKTGSSEIADKVRPIAEDLAGTIANAAQNEAAEKAGLTKRWRSQHDLRVRASHAFLNGDAVPADKAFITHTGTEIRYPHDPAAPLDETINCRCGLEWYSKPPS
jgi:uncharacterized protein with gpF-like domain